MGYAHPQYNENEFWLANNLFVFVMFVHKNSAQCNTPHIIIILFFY